MILFRCPDCGATHRAEAQYAGGTIPCQTCGKQVPIPRESDPECALVYKAGDSEDGLPMTREDVRIKLLSGELSDTDLLWDGTTWRPLSETFGGVHQGEGLHLKKTPQKTESEDELAESLDDLPPIQKLDIDDIVSTGTSRRKATAGKGGLLSRFKKGKAADDRAKESPGSGKAGKKKAGKQGPHGKMHYTMQAVMGLLAIVMGYRFGFGPLISNYRHRPTYVIVQNHENIEFAATFGWRREKKTVYQKSLINFEIFVGMPERQTLRLKPLNGKGESFSVKVPLRPGGITLVNLKRKGRYGIYNAHLVRDKKLATPELKKLAAQIAANQAPSEAIKVNRQIRDLVSGTFVDVKDDLTFISSRYDFPDEMLPLRSKRRAEAERAGKTLPKKPSGKPKPMVFFPAAATIHFANGSAMHDPDHPGTFHRTILLPISSVTLSSSRTLKLAKPMLSISGDAKSVHLSIVQSNRTEHLGGVVFKGQWIYRAACPLEGANRGKWSWHWDFQGHGMDNGKPIDIKLRVDENGDESVV